MRIPFLICCVFAVFLSGCGGGGSSDDGAANGGLHLEVAFPPPVSVSNAELLAVRGSSDDVNGRVTGVTVNGLDAQSDNGFATWTAEVPLQAGENELQIRALDNAGNSVSRTLAVRREVMAPRLRSVVLDADHNRLLSTDEFLQAVISIDLQTGEKSRYLDGGDIRAMLGNESASVSTFRPGALALDPGSRRLLVLDSSRRTLYGVDLDTAELAEISGPDLPQSDYQLRGQAMAVDPLLNRVILPDQSFFNPFSTATSTRFLTIDLSTGLREPLGEFLESSDRVSTLDITVQNTTRRALLAHGNGVYELDLGSGAVSLLHDASTSLQALALSESEGQLYLLDSARNLLQLDLATGARELLSTSEEDLSGALIGFLGGEPTPGLALDLAGNQLLFPGRRRGSVVSVDLTTRNRQVVASLPHLPDTAAQRDIELFSPQELAVDREAQRLLLLNQTSAGAQLLSVDLTSGNKSVIAEEGDDYRWRIFLPGGPVLDHVNDRVLFLAEPAGQPQGMAETALLAVDLSSGAISVISNGAIGARSGFYRDLVLDAGGERLLVLSDEIFSIDLATGQRDTVTALESLAEGFRAREMVLDASNNRLLVLTEESRDVTAVDQGSRGFGFVHPRQLMEVDLASGESQLVDTSQLESFSPYAISMDEDRGRALIADAGRILALDLGSGQFSTLLETAGAGEGRLFTRTPGAIGAGAVSYNFDLSLGGLTATDLETGQQVLISR